MGDIILRVLEAFPEPETSELQRAVFADFGPSGLLADVLASESALRKDSLPNQSPFRVAAFRDDVLVGWSYGYREGKSEFDMLNSGVAAAERRKGVYSQLVAGGALARQRERLRLRHVASRSDNWAVIIAKLRLGFQISGFEHRRFMAPWFDSRTWLGMHGATCTEFAPHLFGRQNEARPFDRVVARMTGSVREQPCSAT